MNGLRVIFMGTPDFSVPALVALREAGHEVVCVYSQPPRQAGRGRTLKPGPVQRAAEARGIPVRTPVSLKDPDAQAAFAALDADIAVVAAYGLILPAAILETPRLGCINIHASLLPRWRGAAPIQRAIMAGDTETGISIMRMDAGLDTGPVLLTRAQPIGPETTAGALHDALAALGAEMIVTALDDPTLSPKPQSEAGATYARKLDAGDERIDWTRPAEEIARLVRALSPRPGAHFMLGGERWKLLAAVSVEALATEAPGTVIDDTLTIACGSGVLRALHVQRPGRKPMDADAALHGHPVVAGTRLD